LLDEYAIEMGPIDLIGIRTFGHYLIAEKKLGYLLEMSHVGKRKRYGKPG